MERGWLGGSQAPGIRPPRLSVRGPGSAAALLGSKGARLRAGEGGGGRGVEGASPRSPPPSPMSLGGRRGVRATFSPLHPALPNALLRGLVRPRPLTSPPSLLPSEPPRVAATTAWEAAGQQRAQWPRPLTGPAQPGSSSSLPGGAREPPERPGAHGEGAGSRPGRGTRGTKPQNREGPRRAGDRGSRDWEALCPPRSGAHGAHRPGSRASSQPDRARDARSLSRDPCREAALARG